MLSTDAFADLVVSTRCHLLVLLRLSASPSVVKHCTLWSDVSSETVREDPSDWKSLERRIRVFAPAPPGRISEDSFTSIPAAFS